ncbi:MAG: ATP-binding protein [Desulfobacterales bacterium]|nr:ATP-binding protein [Desulfobacterales bacterium]
MSKEITKDNPLEYKSIRRAILFRMIFVPMIPFLLSMGIGYYYFATSLENSVTSSMKRIVFDHRRMIESFFKERKSDLELVANSYSLDQLARPEKLEQVFLNLSKSSSAFADLGVFNEDGVHLAYHGPYALTGKVYKKADWFQNVMQKGSFVSDIFLGYRQIPHFVIAVAANSNHPKWVIRASIDTQAFDSLVERVRIGRTGEAYIINSEGILQTNRWSGGKLMEVLDENIRFPSKEDEIQTFISNDPTGREFFYATTWLGVKEWLLVVRQSKSDAFQSLRYATFLIFGVSILGGFVIVGVAFYTTNRIVKRMKKKDAEKNQLGKQLIGASRLAELGEMAAGFAHEINNPLQIIKNEESLIHITISELKDGGSLKPSSELEDIEESLTQIQLQLSRCSQITQSILKFSRQSEPVLSNIDIHKIISEVTGMIAKKADVNGIVLRCDISPNTSAVYGDSSQLQQVLLNLYNNAMDAIIEKHGPSGGRLDIEANQENGWVEISISDNGIGIEKQNIEKVFTPFFTTKSVGKGTGLGLSVCYGIINGMGGEIEVSSQKGAGTNFLIKLPAATI